MDRRLKSSGKGGCLICYVEARDKADGKVWLKNQKDTFNRLATQHKRAIEKRTEEGIAADVFMLSLYYDLVVESEQEDSTSEKKGTDTYSCISYALYKFSLINPEHLMIGEKDEEPEQGGKAEEKEDEEVENGR